MSKPKCCNMSNTFTLYFNILFYISLLVNSKSFIKGVCVHTIPFFVISQWLMLVYNPLKKCNLNKKWYIGLDPHKVWYHPNIWNIITHVVPFIIFIVLFSNNYFKDVSTTYLTWLGLCSVILLALIYFILIKFDMNVYDTHCGKFIIGYIIILIITCVFFF